MRPSSFWVERSPSTAMDNSHGFAKCGTHAKRATEQPSSTTVLQLPIQGHEKSSKSAAAVASTAQLWPLSTSKECGKRESSQVRSLASPRSHGTLSTQSEMGRRLRRGEPADKRNSIEPKDLWCEGGRKSLRAHGSPTGRGQAALTHWNSWGPGPQPKASPQSSREADAFFTAQIRHLQRWGPMSSVVPGAQVCKACSRPDMTPQLCESTPWCDALM